jgi:hypothetical protein
MKKKELREHCKAKCLKVGGTVAQLKARLIEASSDLRLKNVRIPEDIVTIPRGEFQTHFRVAFCITYYQSQGSTFKDRYTIYDWGAFHVAGRARYVALSRATTRDGVQITPPPPEVVREKPGACFKCGELGHWAAECTQKNNKCSPCNFVEMDEPDLIPELPVEILKANDWVENEEDEFVQCDSPISMRILSKRSYGEQYVDEFIRYYELAQVNKSRSLPMRATAAQKNPIDKHANEDYDSHCAEIVAGMKSKRDLWIDRVERENWNLNLLVDDLYVIDLDTPEAVHYFETTIKPKFEDEFSTCPLQTTRKGFHYFFVRPTRCKHFNKARAYKDENGELLEIDCCTSASTGTRGNINVFPSKNKTWIRSIHEFPPKVMSDRLYEYLDKHYVGMKRQGATKTVVSEKRPRQEVLLNDTTKYWTDHVAEASGCPTNGITWSSSTRGRVMTNNRKCMANPNHTAEHDNAFIDIMPDGSLKYTCKSARCGKTIVIAAPISVCGMCQ